MTDELLQKLKTLQRVRGDASPFASSLEYETWADEVAPLLSFNEKLQNSFTHYVRIAKFKSRTGSPNIDQINETIGILNQAVISRGSNNSPISKPKALDPPAKITAQWIWVHATWRLYALWLSSLGAAFFFGVKYSEITIKHPSENLSIAAPQNITSANATSSTTNSASLPSHEITATKQAPIKSDPEK